VRDYGDLTLPPPLVWSFVLGWVYFEACKYSTRAPVRSPSEPVLEFPPSEFPTLCPPTSQDEVFRLYASPFFSQNSDPAFLPFIPRLFLPSRFFRLFPYPIGKQLSPITRDLFFVSSLGLPEASRDTPRGLSDSRPAAFFFSIVSRPSLRCYLSRVESKFFLGEADPPF